MQGLSNSVNLSTASLRGGGKDIAGGGDTFNYLLFNATLVSAREGFQTPFLEDG